MSKKAPRFDTKVPCFACGAILENLMDDGNQPSRGIEFHTGGHYGSTAFDPMDGTTLAINVCDQCLEYRRDWVLQYEPFPNAQRPAPTVWKAQ